MSKVQSWMAVLLIMFGTFACGTAESNLDPRLQGLDAQELEADCDHAQDRAVKGHKVAICHIPPGNPANAHTIIVSKRAHPAHLAHGDVLGGCSCDLIDHPGGGPGNSGGTPGNKNGGPHDDPIDYTPDDSDDYVPTVDDGGGSDGGGGDGDNAGDPGSDDSPPSGDGDDPDWFDDGTNDSPGGDGFGGAGVCDADQILCELNAECPNMHACDMGCCVYVIL